MPLTPEAQSLAVILVGVVILWVTEALPLPVTALAGAIACVVAGVAPAKEVFRPFSEPLVFLFIGSFMLAEAIRVHGLDRRLAFAVLGLPAVGERPGRILAAVAVVSATISAFISNTATTAMMVAIAAGILTAIEDAASPAASPAAPRDTQPRDTQPRDSRLDPRFATGLMLSVAFAASIGGLATPIGTPPNLIGLAFIRNELGIEVSFLAWCAIGVPVAVILTGVAVVLLGWMFPAGVDRLPGVARMVARERSGMGRWSRGEMSTALAFGTTVCLWIVPGILGLFLGMKHPLPAWFGTHVPEGVAALVGAVMLFMLPGASGRRALSWDEAARIDWGIILLYGGGMALGELSFSTGLAEALGRSLTGWLPAGAGGGMALVAAATLVAVVTSEFTSNTASANMVVPVAMALAAASGGDPLTAALAATFAASLGFMMPVSTPCNAIVYGTGRIRLGDMIRSGAILDVTGAVVITLAMLLVRGLWPS
jgi:sodium-dependent dicarboxylate transporter 2/3/5